MKVKSRFCFLLLFVGLCVLNLASASIFMGHSGVYFCNNYFSISPNLVKVKIPAVDITVRKNMIPGSSLGQFFSNLNGTPYFILCAPRNSVYPYYNDDYYLWVTGTKPGMVYVSPDTPTTTIGGQQRTVWTTNQLSVFGIGFALQWEVVGYHYSLRSDTVFPTSPWTTYVPPAFKGLLWRYGINEPYYHGIVIEGIKYGVIVNLTYVLTKPYSDISYPLDSVGVLIPYEAVILEGREASHPIVGRILVEPQIRLRVEPQGTCKSPTVAESVVSFGSVNQSDFPDGQWSQAATRDFTLTFSNCPRVNVKYYVHANGNRWVDSTQGIVGVQGSVPGASDPVAGNPRGFAVQLQHRTGNHQHSGNVYIHPNEVASPLSLPGTQSYTRNRQGAGASNGPTGVTHTIPMRARLVRTGSSSQQQIQFGPFNTSVIVAISYP